jgi:hypothetical protein
MVDDILLYQWAPRWRYCIDSTTFYGCDATGFSVVIEDTARQSAAPRSFFEKNIRFTALATIA